MRRLLLMILSLACVLAMPSCASTGKVASPPPSCPRPQPIPAALTVEPDYARQICELFFTSRDCVKHTSVGSSE